MNEWVEVLLNQEGLFVNTADFNAQETLKSLLNHDLTCSNQIIAKAEKDGEIPVEFILSLIFPFKYNFCIFCLTVFVKILFLITIF